MFVVDRELEEALEEFRRMDDKTAKEVAQTYLLNVLNIGKPDEIEDKWRKSFDDATEYSEYNSLLQSGLKTQDVDPLIRIAVENTVADRPETKKQFVEAVNDAGEKLFVLEVGALAFAAAMIIREYYKKGKAAQTTIIKYGSNGKKIEERIETKYASSSAFGRFFAKIITLGR